MSSPTGSLIRVQEPIAAPLNDDDHVHGNTLLSFRSSLLPFFQRLPYSLVLIFTTELQSELVTLSPSISALSITF